MADFILSASTMNLDGRRSSWVRKLTMYTLATAGAKIARKPGESKRAEFALGVRRTWFRFGLFSPLRFNDALLSSSIYLLLEGFAIRQSRSKSAGVRLWQAESFAVSFQRRPIWYLDQRSILHICLTVIVSPFTCFRGYFEARTRGAARRSKTFLRTPKIHDQVAVDASRFDASRLHKSLSSLSFRGSVQKFPSGLRRSSL